VSRQPGFDGVSAPTVRQVPVAGEAGSFLLTPFRGVFFVGGGEGWLSFFGGVGAFFARKGVASVTRYACYVIRYAL